MHDWRLPSQYEIALATRVGTRQEPRLKHLISPYQACAPASLSNSFVVVSITGWCLLFVVKIIRKPLTMIGAFLVTHLPSVTFIEIGHLQWWATYKYLSRNTIRNNVNICDSRYVYLGMIKTRHERHDTKTTATTGGEDKTRKHEWWRDSTDLSRETTRRGILNNCNGRGRIPKIFHILELWYSRALMMCFHWCGRIPASLACVNGEK